MVNTEWQTTTFDQVAKVYRGGSPRPIQAYITTNPDGVNWIKIGDVKVGDKYITATEEKIKPEGVSRSRRVYSGDFILSNSMSFGRPYILKLDGCIHDGWLTIQDYQDTFNIDFLYYLLSSENVMQQYISMAAGSSVKNLNKEKVSSLIVSYPEKLEQQVIATALSDVDELIANLEKLIEKKKAIKQGAMQELLTGKRRLPGFTGEWTKCKLSEIGKFQKGASISRDESHTGSIPAVRYGELYTHHDFYVKKYNSFISEEVANKSRKLKYGDIVFTASGETKEDIGKSAAILTDDAYAGGDLFIYRISVENNPIFMGFLLDSPSVKRQKSERAQGDAVVHIHADSLAEIVVYLPEIGEQNAIAKILYDMDQEIDALQSKLEKYRGIKQGMMQKLLTGEIRLV